MLGPYAWFLATSPDRAHPCGSLLPNDLGLFDMLGNVYEWCLDPALVYEPGKDVLTDDITIQLFITDKRLCVSRGGAFGFLPAVVRSAHRLRDTPADINISGGFRLARTYP